LAHLEPADVEYFSNATNCFVAWDHRWPSELILARRYKFLCSSELFFGVEITEPRERPALLERPGEDRYHEAYVHHETHAPFVGSIRIE
jgi:hypothetical protein